MWIKRDFTLSHCHPNIRTIAKPQYVLSGKWWVFTDKLYELAGFVHVKAEIEFRILSEECLSFRTVSLAKRFPNGVEDIQQESWPGRAADVLKQMQDSRDIQRNSWAGRD